MADAVLSQLAGRLTNFIVDEIQNELNLVRGVKEKVNKLSEELTKTRDFLDDAERRGYTDKNIKDWLWRLEDASYEMDDVLDEWEMAAIHEVPSRSSCLCFKNVSNHHRIGKKINCVTTKLDDIFKEKNRYNLTNSASTDPTRPVGGSWRGQSTSFLKIDEIRGRDHERDNLLRKVLDAGSREQDSTVHVISMVGLGGIGKTTLAQLIYNDKQVDACYPYRIWICVSDPFDEAGIAKGIIEKVEGSSPGACQLDTLLELLKSCISGKKFLLVMDDVWTEDDAKWGPLKNCLEFGGLGSKILVTTRKERVAITMGTKRHDIHNVGRLSDEDCWLLLSQIALLEKSPSERNEFEEVGKRIAKKCDGLPLAAKALGSLLRFKYTEDEWENVVNSEIWEMEKSEIDIFPHLLLSYNELSPTLKRCFSYCAVFPKDFEINVLDLIQRWSALGYLGTEGELELRGREYFDNLAMRSLFQDFGMDRKNDHVILECKMHDIVHDFATFLRKNTSENRVEASCTACGSSLASHVKKYKSLFCEGKPPPKIGCECMVSVRILSIKDCGLTSIPIQVEKLIHLRYLKLKEIQWIGKNLKMIFKLCNLKTLHLSSCNIEEIPQEIENLVKLRKLKLKNNESLKNLPKSICNLQELRSLSLKACENLCRLPREIHKLEKLKHLNLSGCGLQEIPQEIGNLVKLLDLDLSWCPLKELPKSIYDLQKLQSLCLKGCYNLVGLPHGIHRLEKLKHLDISDTDSLECFPDEDVGRMIHLCKLSQFKGRLSYLKNLKELSGFLQLEIGKEQGEKDVVEEAKGAELSKKVQIQRLLLRFNYVDESIDDQYVSMVVLDALKPHPNLNRLSIDQYSGFKLPDWISSPVNQVRKICFSNFKKPLMLPPLGKLPCLETLELSDMEHMELVGRELLGVTKLEKDDSGDAGPSSSTPCTTVAFPMLRLLMFSNCPKWKEWEDITAEEQNSTVASYFPNLKSLNINKCGSLKALPHGLLRKATLLGFLSITDSKLVEEHYDKRKEDSGWKSISHIPEVRLIHSTVAGDTRTNNHLIVKNDIIVTDEWTENMI